MKKTIRDVEVAGKRVLVRADLNVPMEQGRIVDDARIRAALPTLQYLIKHRARVIVVSHLGRPDGFVVEGLRMNPVAERLASLLQQPVGKINNCIGPEVHDAVKNLEPGQVLLLENVRFHPGEMVNDAHFSARLAAFADLYVSDAFASAHRMHASNYGITQHLPSVAGLLMESELEGLARIRDTIRPPVVVLLGGERLVDKVRFIQYCLEPSTPQDSDLGAIRGARVLLGGILANTLLRARGHETGQSDTEMRSLGIARELLEVYGGQIQLPLDVVVADTGSTGLNARTQYRVTSVERVPLTGCIVDIGPATVERYLQTLDGAGTVIWNGPLGVAEMPAFSQATNEIARKIASLENTVTIVGGGDTTVALDRSGLASRIDYLSTGGAAFLAALRGEDLPGVTALDERDETPQREPHSGPQSGPHGGKRGGTRSEESLGDTSGVAPAA